MDAPTAGEALSLLPILDGNYSPPDKPESSATLQKTWHETCPRGWWSGLLSWHTRSAPCRSATMTSCRVPPGNQCPHPSNLPRRTRRSTFPCPCPRIPHRLGTSWQSGQMSNRLRYSGFRGLLVEANKNDLLSVPALLGDGSPWLATGPPCWSSYRISVLRHPYIPFRTRELYLAPCSCKNACQTAAGIWTPQHPFSHAYTTTDGRAIYKLDQTTWGRYPPTDCLYTTCWALKAVRLFPRPSPSLCASFEYHLVPCRVTSSLVSSASTPGPGSPT